MMRYTLQGLYDGRWKQITLFDGRIPGEPEQIKLDVDISGLDKAFNVFYQDMLHELAPVAQYFQGSQASVTIANLRYFEKGLELHVESSDRKRCLFGGIFEYDPNAPVPASKERQAAEPIPEEPGSLNVQLQEAQQKYKALQQKYKQQNKEKNEIEAKLNALTNVMNLNDSVEKLNNEIQSLQATEEELKKDKQDAADAVKELTDEISSLPTPQMLTEELEKQKTGLAEKRNKMGFKDEQDQKLDKDIKALNDRIEQKNIELKGLQCDEEEADALISVKGNNIQEKKKTLEEKTKEITQLEEISKDLAVKLEDKKKLIKNDENLLAEINQTYETNRQLLQERLEQIVKEISALVEEREDINDNFEYCKNNLDDQSFNSFQDVVQQAHELLKQCGVNLGRVREILSKLKDERDQ